MSECVVRIPKHIIEEMRKIGCGGCPFKFQNCLLKEDVGDTCPILAVLPEKHGRLVDADAFNLPKGFFEKVDNVPKFYEWLNSLPTIVPAEVDEVDGKRYGECNRERSVIKETCFTNQEWFCADAERNDANG